MKAIYKQLSLIIFLCLLSVHIGISQNFIDKTMSKADSLVMSQRQKKANKNFEGMAYVKAIEKYEKLMQKGVGADTLKSKLATAYYKVGNTEKAEPLFREVVSGSQFIPEDLYFFSQTLKYNQKYEEADQWMDKYQQLKSSDSRSEIQHKAAPKILEIVEHERYVVNEVNFNSSKADFGPVVIGNQIVFATGRNDEKIIRREYAWDESPYLDIYTIKKDAGALASAKLLSGKLSSAFHDGPACFSNEGNDIYFTRNNYQKYVHRSDKKVIEHLGVFNKITPKKSKAGVNNLMIMHAKKNGSDWTYPEALPFNSYEYSCGHPCLSPDNKTMYFASDMPGGFGGSDIYKVSLTEEGWGEPVNLGANINTEGEEMFPFMHQNGQLYFCSNGQLTLGGLDVFVAVKKDNGYQVKNMGYPLNTSSDDFSFFLEEEGVHGYFASNREGGTGNDDIYRFEIIDKMTFNQSVTGRLIDKNTKQILPFTPVELIDSEGLVMANLTTDSLGMIHTELQKMQDITAVVNTKDYFPYRETFKLSEESSDFEMVLSPQPYFGIFGNVFLLPDMTPIPQVTVYMEAVGGEVATIVSGNDGNFKTKLAENTSYDLVFTKKNYFTKRVHYSTVGRDTGYVNVNEFMQLEMEKAEIGKSIEIKILYDLGKWNIREDAAGELDDMIQFLKDNPNIKIELGSHTDARGSAVSNQVLSQKRAESAVKYMVSRGISSARITAKGYGETRLKNKCADGVPCSEEEHQANRRSEVTIVEM
jgi:outer membrane protein OmpA-like peptidoglycan-associated protein/tetratricopeptide (TPR) repeat protein